VESLYRSLASAIIRTVSSKMEMKTEKDEEMVEAVGVDAAELLALDETEQVNGVEPMEHKSEEEEQPEQNHIHFGEAHLAAKEDVAAGVERGNIILAGEEAETLALPQVICLLLQIKAAVCTGRAGQLLLMAPCIH
jgi:hypothetical protein